MVPSDLQCERRPVGDRGRSRCSSTPRSNGLCVTAFAQCLAGHRPNGRGQPSPDSACRHSSPVTVLLRLTSLMPPCSVWSACRGADQGRGGLVGNAASLTGRRSDLDLLRPGPKGVTALGACRPGLEMGLALNNQKGSTWKLVPGGLQAEIASRHRGVSVPPWPIAEKTLKGGRTRSRQANKMQGSASLRSWRDSA